MTTSTTETKILGLDDLSRQQLYEIIMTLKAQEKPVEATENILYAEWFEDYEDQELDFYEWVFKKKLPNGLKIIDSTPDHKLVADAHRGNMKGDDHG